MPETRGHHRDRPAPCGELTLHVAHMSVGAPSTQLERCLEHRFRALVAVLLLLLLLPPLLSKVAPSVLPEPAKVRLGPAAVAATLCSAS